ncbi:MAG: hypothetical protein LWW90_09705, partial [Candidatus Desulfofervidus auxilii]|nr:hypothetical protein [Candidatus Desulfofervidus auxilii]
GALSAFIGEPEFAGNFLDSLFLNLNSAVKKNGISLHTQEEETEKVLYKFANNRQTAVLFWNAVFQAIREAMHKNPFWQ